MNFDDLVSANCNIGYLEETFELWDVTDQGNEYVVAIFTSPYE